MQGPVRVDGNSVNLEQEVAAMADNEIRYQMLTDMTRRYFSGMRDVIQGGR
jgi:flagellar basal-body rod protein FlgB